MSATDLWWITLGGGLVVVAVVATLLGAIVATARRIKATLAELWVTGKAIANNTVHIDLLRRVNFNVSHITEDVRRMAGETRHSGEGGER